MAYWEFLLQKEGDRSWLPLESPNVEILEGRYRVVARTSRTQAPVEIRVTHVSTEEVPPKRRVQKRSHQTNGEGLMVVFPFTRLSPGIWEIVCVGDVMADLLGQGWTYSVHLQVLSHQQEGEGDWEPDWQAPEAVPGSSSAEVPVLTEVAPLAAAALCENPFQAALAELTAQSSLPPAAAPETVAVEVTEPADLNSGSEAEPAELPQSAEPAPMPPWDEVSEPEPGSVVEVPFPASAPLAADATVTPIDLATALLEDAWGPGVAAADEPAALAAEPGLSAPPNEATIANWTFQLLLDQVNFIATWGQGFTLTGQVEITGMADSSPGQSQSWQSELQVCLRDPQTLQVLGSFCQPIAVTPPTTRFACAIEIPADCQTRLLLGELSLYSLMVSHEPSLTPLVTQTFTITAALDELLGVLPDLGDGQPGERLQRLEPNLELYASPLGEPTEATDLSQLSLVFLDLLKAPKQSVPLQFQPSESQPLPPQIYRPTPVEPLAKSPQLPTFRKGVAETPISPPVEEDADPVVDLTADQPNGLPDQGSSVAAVEDLVDHPHPEPDVTLAPEPPQESSPPEGDRSPGSTTFQSLRLQERFWSRLSAIATDAELSAWLKADSSTREPTAEQSPGGMPDAGTAAAIDGVDLLAEFPVEPEDAWLAREIVVDDEREEGLPARVDDLVPIEMEELSSDEEGVPVPELEVPEGELIAGKRVTVRVKLPQAVALTHVKLWINDRQTRSLMDGPRWITDFIPNGAGVLETSTQVTVPFGSLEVQFEAIAITLRNQRESRKVSVSRAVVPPDLPTLSLDELDA